MHTPVLFYQILTVGNRENKSRARAIVLSFEISIFKKYRRDN